MMALSPHKSIDATPCPCGSGRCYRNCCGSYHSGKNFPETAEQLMRSRYAAYALKLADYLYQTTHPDKRSMALQDEIADWAAQVEFFRLEVLSVRRGQANDKVGKVEFVAHYRLSGEMKQMRELSRFRRFEGKWHYFDGEFN